MEQIKAALAKCFSLQLQAVEAWHKANEFLCAPHNDNSNELYILLLRNLRINYDLWHIEDIARRTDIDTAIIANCKRDVDKLNQERTDSYEQIDEYLVNKIQKTISVGFSTSPTKYNTESLGMALDRTSILALKIYHMEEQIRRDDVDAQHINNCIKKYEILLEQRSDLITAINDLIDDYCCGIKCPKVYYQFKMYNDPALNPELYKST